MQLIIVGTLDGQIGAASQIAIKRGAKVQQADTLEDGLDLLRRSGADLVMIDVVLEVADFMAAIEAERINVPVVACGVSNDTQAAVRAVRAGAKEYVPLPPDPELIAAVLEAVTEDQHALIFKDPKMAETVKMATQIAPSEASVLITGPSGTGKEVLAHYLHSKSKRKDRRFVAVNCAAIPENLLESELFGHEKGAFTGAVARRIGKFEEADGGTILLDEISEMDVRLQSKLLRVIQEREVDRIGSNKPVPVNVRIIATSNRNMEQTVKEGGFREDLYFRLNVVNLRLPPLAERPGDVMPLARHFATKYADANDVPQKPISEDAQKKLATYHWPGNVRELENTMHRAVLLAAGDEIDAAAILLTSEDGATSAAAGNVGEDGAQALVGRTVADVERELIIDTLQHCLGNRTHAANILGISIRTLRNKLKQYGNEGFNIPSPGDASQAGA
ncbi:MAG: sigma-54-dependent Fis family transcriptional regulator [Rhodospirillales bacterium]|nr:sigma-54-dependent Fis family transcriptional regulator [Rhodospirillales bacterium]